MNLLIDTCVYSLPKTSFKKLKIHLRVHDILSAMDLANTINKLNVKYIIFPTPNILIFII